MTYRKKLIEVALPLEAINKASAREKSIRHGHPSTLHLWWARRPLAAARAVIFAQMVDDPSAHSDLFPTEKKQEKERQRLFRIIEELVKWESTTNETVLQAARDEIWNSWRRTCAENADHPRAKELFDRNKLPAFHDPFAGGGSLPLEAQRLGLEACASDLNPVAVLICKAMIEIPPRFTGKPPVNPAARVNKDLIAREWKGAQGLAEDIQYYGRWMRDEAEKRIGYLYPKVEITADMARERKDLKPLVGQRLTVIAWIWVRTVRSPNPAFAKVHVPLASTFQLATKPGKEAWIETVVEGGRYRFNVKAGKAKDPVRTGNGTKLARGANFRCIVSGTPIEGGYIKAEGQAGRMGARLMAVVAEGERGRVYLSPTPEHEATALKAMPRWKPDGRMVEDARAFTPSLYGQTNWSDLFTERQLLALTVFSDLLDEVTPQIESQARIAGLADFGTRLSEDGSGAAAYAEAVRVYLALTVSRSSSMWSSNCWWQPTGEFINQVFTRQAIAVVWDFAECNPLSTATGNWVGALDWICRVLMLLPSSPAGTAIQHNAMEATTSSATPVVSTDPPYFDNVPYADLSDFYYTWQRRLLEKVYPDLFATLAVPKNEELVVTSYRHGGKKEGGKFFLDGMTTAMGHIRKEAHPAFPISVYYAFRQSEVDDAAGTASTGWETFLGAVTRAGFAIVGTWPVRTERPGRMRENASNALASSIVLVCRPRSEKALAATRRELVCALKSELPGAMAQLQRGNIAPVDLAQAAIGPGMAVFTRYSKVIDAAGKELPVREALALINETVDAVLVEQEGDFDADTRWALAWFGQSGFDEGEYGVAETLSKAKNTSVAGMVEAGILSASRGKVRLLEPDELSDKWDPASDPRLTAWEMVHQLIRALEAGGEGAAAALVAKLGSQAEVARELCYRLYTLCERKKRAAEALSYNALVQSWPEITRLASEGGRVARPKQADLLEQE